MTSTLAQPRTRTAWTVWLPLLVAALLGLVIGLAPDRVAMLLLGAVALGAVLLRVEWAALLVVAIAPFEDYASGVAPGAVKATAALLVVAWVVRRCRGRLHHLPASPVLVPALAFIVVLLVSTSVHNNGTYGLQVVLRYAGFIAVLLVLADVLRGPLTPERLARAYVLSCTAAAGAGLLSFAFAGDRRVGGPIGDPNDFAFYLLAALPLCLGLRPESRRPWLWMLAAGLLVLAILGTLSRGGLVGMAVMGVVALATRMVRLRTVAGLTATVVAAVTAVIAVVPGMVTLSLAQKSDVAGQNVSERLQLWQAASRMIENRPLLGHGPGAFALENRNYLAGPPPDIVQPLDVAHNTWLEIGAELGLLGLGAFVALLVVAYWQARRAQRAGDHLAAGVCAGLVGCAVAATFLTEQYYLPLWMLAALAVGVGARVRRHEVARMRVVQVTTQSGGGPVDHAVDVAAGLARRGHDSHVVGPRTPRTPAAEAAGVTWHATSVSSKRDAGGAARAARLLRALRPEVLHLQDRRAGWLGRALGPTLRGTGVVYTLHGVPDGLSDLVPGNALAGPRRRRDRLYYLHGERAITRWGRARVVVPSAAVATYAVDHVGLDPAVVDVVPNGVDPDRFEAAQPSGDAPTVVWVGGFDPVKRVDLLLEAVAAVPSVRLLLVGDGPLRSEVERRAHGLAGRVELAGRVPDPRPLLARADLFALTSAAENCPMALLEAMASGLPVVATAVGGVPEVVRAGVDGLLCRAGDGPGIARAVATLAGDAGLRVSAGRAARERIASCYSLDRCLDGLLASYLASREVARCAR